MAGRASRVGPAGLRRHRSSRARRCGTRVAVPRARCRVRRYPLAHGVRRPRPDPGAHRRVDHRVCTRGSTTSAQHGRQRADRGCTPRVRNPRTVRPRASRHPLRCTGVVSALLGTRRRIGPRIARHARRTRRRPLDRQRTEGVVFERPHRRSRDPPRADRPRCAITPRYLVLHHRHAVRGRGDAAAPPDERRRRVRRSLPPKRRTPGRCFARPGWAGRWRCPR